MFDESAVEEREEEFNTSFFDALVQKLVQVPPLIVLQQEEKEGPCAVRRPDLVEFFKDSLSWQVTDV